jgi:protein involved in polysaccharide export with SLBB domain
LNGRGITIDTIRVSIKRDYIVRPGDTVKISVDAIDDLTGKNAKSFSFTLKYKKQILSFDDVVLSGTLSNSLDYSIESSTPGELIVKVINNTETPLIGTGKLIDINFIGLRGDSCGTRLVLESFAFNSDGPNVITENGYCELFGGCGGEGQTYITTDQSTLVRQNSPNPIQAGYESTIEYRIHVAGEINLTVYDILGREVTKLVNEYKPEGTYSVTFNTKGLPSGVYFYRLRARGYEGLKKMVIIR